MDFLSSHVLGFSLTLFTYMYIKNPAVAHGLELTSSSCYYHYLCTVVATWRTELSTAGCCAAWNDSHVHTGTIRETPLCSVRRRATSNSDRNCKCTERCLQIVEEGAAPRGHVLCHVTFCEKRLNSSVHRNFI